MKLLVLTLLVSILLIGPGSRERADLLTAEVYCIETNQKTEDVLLFRSSGSMAENEWDSLMSGYSSARKILLGTVELNPARSTESLLHLQNKGVKIHPIASPDKAEIHCRFTFYSMNDTQRFAQSFRFDFDTRKKYLIAYQSIPDCVFVVSVYR